MSDATMNEQRIHRIFVASVGLKGLNALVECLGGLLLALINTQTIVDFVAFLTRHELTEDPHDFIASHLLAIAQSVSIGTKNFYAFYLLSHGVVKLVLVIGLLRNALWSYPASLFVLALFIAYQMYRYSYTHSLFLIVLTIFDLFVMVLVWHEYRLLRRTRAEHLPAGQ